MKPKPYLIGIAGPSGAGKSFLADHLRKHLPDSIVLALDAYYPDLRNLPLREREHLNFDDPAILDSKLLLEHIGQLCRGQSIQQPVYDFSCHTRSETTRPIYPASFVIIEGLFTFFWPELRELLETRVYVDLPDELCLERRIARDVHERGRIRESVERQYRESTVPMANLNVRPTAKFAEVIVSGSGPIESSIDAVLAHVFRNR